MDHKLLSRAQFECLRLIGSGAGGQSACSKACLDALVAQGLVEAVPRWTLPGFSSRVEYRITATGHQLLNPGLGCARRPAD